MFIVGLGAVLFGFIIGWIVYRKLRLRAGAPWYSDLLAVLGAIVGVAVLALFRDELLLGWYLIGLALGVVAYFGMGLILHRQQEVQFWRLEQIPPASTHDQGSDIREDSL